MASTTLRAMSKSLVFGVGALDVANGGFNAGHLREHMATGTAIVVVFQMVDGRRVAGRLTDAGT